MRLKLDFSSLEKAARRIGASAPVDLVVDVRRGVDPVDPIDIELNIGIELDLSEITSDPTGLLTYRGRQVVLYIQDHGWNIHEALIDGSTGKKVHVADCDTLQYMRRENRYERYVATNNVSGDFHVTGHDGYRDLVEGKAKLRVCKNCLRMLNYKDYTSNRNQVFQAFEWNEFFDAYRSHFAKMPSRLAGDSDGTYTMDWDRVSGQYKEAQAFTCESCGLGLREHPRLLHVHHKDGVKTNNAWLNLKALCIDCHSKQPAHSHMHMTNAQASLINRLRQQQNLL